MKSELFATIQLDNGVRIAFNDCTNRYYGDYHRVSIEVNLSFAVDDYHSTYRFQMLERMGVSSADVVAVQTQLIDSFRHGTMKYMTGDKFADKFFLSYQKRKPVLLAGLK